MGWDSSRSIAAGAAVAYSGQISAQASSRVATLPWRPRCRKASQNPPVGVSFSVPQRPAPPQRPWWPCPASQVHPQQRPLNCLDQRLKKVVDTAFPSTSSAITKPREFNSPVSFLRRAACFSRKNPTVFTAAQRIAMVRRDLCKACPAACQTPCQPWIAALFCAVRGLVSVSGLPRRN